LTFEARVKTQFTQFIGDFGADRAHVADDMRGAFAFGVFAYRDGTNIHAGGADAIFEKLAAFANFGFPESHSVSFAYLVYSSAWFKLHYPAAFCAALLNAQPMGFWSPHTLTRDAKRHGVNVRRPDVNASDWWSTLERDPGSHRDAAVRLGIKEVRAVGEELVARATQGPVAVVFGDERSGLTNAEVERCHDLSAVPTDTSQPSINLAQAVLLYAYEVRMASLAASLPRISVSTHHHRSAKPGHRHARQSVPKHRRSACTSHLE
jgi:tRNA(Leu) C34 or U34 (ribose-2'-O)-methylase TrmL